MLPMPPSAAAIAIGEALKRVHGPYKNNVNTVVDPLVTYYTGRGESLADIPLDVPSVNKTDHERRWRARLVAAGVADQGDIEDFLLWMDARSAPVGAGGAGAASGLAKVALVALESVGDRPSAAGMTALEKSLALGEAGDEESQCQCALVAFLLIWGSSSTSFPIRYSLVASVPTAARHQTPGERRRGRVWRIIYVSML